MKKLLVLLILLISMQSFAQTKLGKIKEVNVAKLERKAKKNIQLLDVRTLAEYEQGYIGEAINVDVQQDDFLAKVQFLDKNKPVYIYCRSGKRGELAAKKLAESGFRKILNLKGGILAWEAAHKSN